jgi:hypothetical protein
VDLGKPSEPLRMSADVEIGSRVKVAMAASFITAEDHYWAGPRRHIVKQVFHAREFVRSGAEFPPKQSG